MAILYRCWGSKPGFQDGVESSNLKVSLAVGVITILSSLRRVQLPSHTP